MNLKKLACVALLGMSFASYSFAESADVSDSSITSSVKTKIAAEKILNGSNIMVNTVKGVVNFSGNVNSDTQANTATELAQGTSGVTDVDASALTINGSKHPLDDALITAKVKGRFMQQKLFGDKDIAAMTIKVETENGVVHLSGTSDNKAQADNAIKIAKEVAGVKEVKSRIKNAD